MGQPPRRVTCVDRVVYDYSAHIMASSGRAGNLTTSSSHPHPDDAAANNHRVREGAGAIEPVRITMDGYGLADLGGVRLII
jgi:hypothetical protein